MDQRPAQALATISGDMARLVLKTKSSDCLPSGSRTITSRSGRSGQTAYQTTGKAHNSRRTPSPRTSMRALDHSSAGTLAAITSRLGSRSPFLRGRPRWSGRRSGGG